MKRPLTIIGALPLATALCLLPGVAPGAQYGPGDTFRDCNGCPLMVVVPQGSYMMGSTEDYSEGPVHRVTIGKPFAVGVYEATWGEWDMCVAQGGCQGYVPDDYGLGRRANQPVINVSWEDATAYVEWLSSKTGERYRLLSEAEWEYSARAGTMTRYHWGNRVSPTRAHYLSAGSCCKTMPVGSYPPNDFGLYDMHGNVNEWVADCWNWNYEGAPTDGSVWEEGNCNRSVRRGGAWSAGAGELRSAFRFGNPISLRHDCCGFRVAKTLD